MIDEKKMDANKIASVITNISNDIIISGHKNADFDAMCSSLALAYCLKKVNKNVKVFIESESIKKIEYFDLNYFLCNEFYSKDYTFIALDLNRISRLPSIMEDCYLNVNFKINVDHHNGNSTNADYILSDCNAGSTCEMVYDIIKKMGIRLDKKLSELLFTGIISDTNLFSNNVSNKTFSIASKLLNYNINNEFLIRKFYLEKTKDEMDVIMYINNNLNNCGFSYAILDMKNELFNRVSYSDISKKCIPIILNRSDVDLLMVIMDYGHKVKGEIRSKNNIDVSKLAELLTGGGHTNAAGFSNKKSVSEIITITKKYLSGAKNGV